VAGLFPFGGGQWRGRHDHRRAGCRGTLCRSRSVLALAGLLGFVLAPLVRRLTNWGLPNGLSVALVIVLLLGSLSAGGMVVGRQLTQLLEDLPAHEANLRDKARFVQFELGGTGIWQRAVATVRRIEEEVRDPQADRPLKNEVAQGTEDPLMTIFEYTRVSVPSLMSAVLVLLLTIFILLQYRDLRDRMVRLMGTAEMGRSTQAFDEASVNLGHYLLLQSTRPLGRSSPCRYGQLEFPARSCGGP
jgi:predicted PurR-regulated permease PerM